MSALVNAHWLHEHLHRPELVVLDASISFQIPNTPAPVLDEVIPGALRFDYDDDFHDPSYGLPHMMPSESAFNRQAQALGLNNDSVIVVYDNTGTFASPRAWWMLKSMGHEQVYVLNGGLPAWIAQGYATQPIHNESKGLGNFQGQRSQTGFIHADSVLAFANTNKATILDARSQARFDAQVPEPREGIRSGHIPHSQCLPFSLLIDNGQMKDRDALASAFASRLAAHNDNQPLVFSCGSGVTACILALAAYELGHRQLQVYDGSWTEWGSRPDLPIEC